MSVSPETSAIELPMPMSPNSKIPMTAADQKPRMISGTPKRTIPNMKAGLSRRAPVSERATIAPMNAPTPIAELRMPTPLVSEAEEFDRRDDDEHLYSAGERMSAPR